MILCSTLFINCKPEYKLHIDAVSKNNAPALQSFAHGVHKDDWLLFAGRTNSKDSLDGGLHGINGNVNYANTSFPPPSFNEDIFVYNVKKDDVKKISFTKLTTLLEANFPSYVSVVEDFKLVFKNTNSQVKQVGEYLYLVGGYGRKDGGQVFNYVTYNQIARIHVPSLVHLVKGDLAKVDKYKLFAFGRQKDSLLSATGGELQAIGSAKNPTLYLVGGHNFGYYTPQKYQDAAYPFTVTADTINHTLKVNVKTPISDVLYPTDSISDDLSIMRRRDGPILPALYKSPVVTSGIQQGFAFYAGVFKPGSDLQAWNDAVYFHPQWANAEGKLFTHDKTYNQNNYNVYSCPNVTMFDSKSNLMQSFLMGGIGDGQFDKKGNLSGFTNTAVHIKMDITKKPLASTQKLISSDHLFTQKSGNVPPYYGAEAIFFTNQELKNYTLSNGVETEILDVSSFGDGDVFLGYIYGGIEAFQSNPGTYGKRNSRASNKIWKVVLKKK